uniref:Uncharacterized protein n=1 Tax=Timema tahoe TaxID=61484 RepID=A0A7R9IB56_9NEOP|nr:unnamed protein product [Timema tahoe]
MCSSSTSLTGSTSNSAVTNSSGRSLRNDLLVAADSVTNAMSTLVRELNSEGSDQEEGEENIRKPLAASKAACLYFYAQPVNGSALMCIHETGSWLQTLFEMYLRDFEAEDGESDGTGNTAALWREEIRKRYEQESQFMAELRSRNLGNGHDYDDKGVGGKVMGCEDAELYEQALRRHASGLPDGDGYKEVDELYVHGPDDDDTGGTNWEEAMKRMGLLPGWLRIRGERSRQKFEEIVPIANTNLLNIAHEAGFQNLEMEDIEEVADAEIEELSNEELQELAQNPNPESDSEEDKPSRKFTTKSMATAFHRTQEGLQMLANEDPDVERSARVHRTVMEGLTCY